MAKLIMRFEVLLPRDRKWPDGMFKKWDTMTTVYMTGPLQAFLLDDFRETVERWTRKPNFKATYNTPYNTRKQVMVFPIGRYTLNWSRVSEGTRSRSIVPRRAPALVFPRFYTPHTSQYQTGYGGPGVRHGPIIHTRLVRNHSIAPRKFTKNIAKKEERRILKDFRDIALKAFR